MVWMLTLGLVPVVGLSFPTAAQATSSCEAVSASVYIAVYNTYSGTTDCHTSGYIQLSGNAGDELEVTVHVPSFDPDDEPVVTYMQQADDEPHFLEMTSTDETFVVSYDDGPELFVGLRTAPDQTVWAKPSGKLVFDSYTGSEDAFILGDADESAEDWYYDLSFELPGNGESYIKLFDKYGNEIASGRLNGSARYTFFHVPIPSEGQIYAQIYANEASKKADAMLIGFIPAGHNVVKTVFRNWEIYNEYYDLSLNAGSSSGISLLSVQKNNLFALDAAQLDEMSMSMRELLVDATVYSPDEEPESHLVTLLYSGYDFYGERVMRLDQDPMTWETVTLQSAYGSEIPPEQLAGVRVYVSIEDLGLDGLIYAYTDSNGRATFSMPGGPEDVYEFSTVSEINMDGYKPRLIQVGPSRYDNDRRVLDVRHLKKPEYPDADPDFNLTDLVWYAQHIYSPEYHYDASQNGVIDRDDLLVYMRALAPIPFPLSY